MASGTVDLERFVRDALLRDLPRTDIQNSMLEAGWTPAQAKTALSAFVDSDFPIPVPKPRPYLSAREAFLYLVLFSALYLTAFHLGSLVFDLIDRALPDAAARIGTWRADSMRFSASALLVGFPLLVFMSWYINRGLALDPVKRLSAVRRWLTYLTLFTAVTILSGDLIALVYNLLGGELTVRFMLKVATVAVIAGALLGYYLLDLRQEERE